MVGYASEANLRPKVTGMDSKRNHAAKIKAWSVHIFTATGMVVGFKALERAFAGDVYHTIVLLLITVLIDSVDGTLARRFKVKEVLPTMDGRMIDFVVDYVNFVITPVVIFYKMQMVPGPLLLPSVAGILYASLYHYGNTAQVTSDFRFKGFPAFWNIVIYYLFILDLGAWPNFAITLLVILLHLLPVHFIYLTRMQRNKLAGIVAVIWLILVNIVILVKYPAVGTALKIAAAVPFLFLAALGSIERELLPFSSLRSRKTT
jgi:phosphatidylcholine synthase